ncbi:MAG: transglycosylase SLT domain-containing protein [Betaproteobacteria bacterium]
MTQPGLPAADEVASTIADAPTIPAVAEFAVTKPKYATVWERIRVGFKMPDIDDPLVRKWENFYAARPEYWQRINERGRRYLYFITAEIERRGMPLEIALLPIIESAYNPEALSRARASGIWQFIPATGKLYGLQQNWWLDDRRDVGAATSGALDYLEKLHDMFGDWQLALASYNWGEGAVQRAMSRNRALRKPVDYASLKIPTETRNYLPKLQAVKNLIIAPEKFGLSLPEVPDAPYFTTVTTGRQIDVALAARLADMPLEDFRILNPAHNRPVMAGSGEQKINLPWDKAETFVLNLDAYALPLVSWRPYQVKLGEKLEHVAERFGMNLLELKRVNGLSGRRKVAPGHTLLVPGSAADAAAPPIQTALFKDAPRDGPGMHRVRRGETLAGIASRYDLTPAELKKLNGLQGDAIPTGSRLRLHDGASVSAGKVKAGKRGSKKKTVTPTRRR